MMKPVIDTPALEHGPIGPLTFYGKSTTLGQMLAAIASIEATEPVEVCNVVRDPVTKTPIGVIFRLEHR
jgi:hypothetical protein